MITINLLNDNYNIQYFNCIVMILYFIKLIINI